MFNPESQNLAASSIITMFGDVKDSYLSKSGGVSTGSGLPGPFEYVDGKIINCKLYFGRKLLSCADFPCSATTFRNSDIYAVVTHTGDTMELTVEAVGRGVEMPDEVNVTYRLLYAGQGSSSTDSGSDSDEGENISASVDYRFMPIIVATE